LRAGFLLFLGCVRVRFGSLHGNEGSDALGEVETHLARRHRPTKIEIETFAGSPKASAASTLPGSSVLSSRPVRSGLSFRQGQASWRTFRASNRRSNAPEKGDVVTTKSGRRHRTHYCACRMFDAAPHSCRRLKEHGSDDRPASPRLSSRRRAAIERRSAEQYDVALVDWRWRTHSEGCAPSLQIRSKMGAAV
jgi:hypothetical protein